MHVGGSSSSNRRLPMKGNITWGGGNSSFNGRMQRGENSFCGGWMFVGGNSYSGGEMDLGSRMPVRWNGLRDGGIHVGRNSLGNGPMHFRRKYILVWWQNECKRK